MDDKAVASVPLVSRQLRFGLLAIFLPAILMRFILPLHFPMIFWDEGLWNLGPKHAVMIGDPFAFGWSHAFLSPLHYLTTLLLYNLFTPSLVLSRWVSGLFGIGVVIFTYLLGKRFFDHRAALIAAILIAYNSLMIFSSRQAMLEQEVAFYMMAAAFFWFHSRRDLKWISGLFMAAALAVKANALAIFLALFIGQMFLGESKKAGSKSWLKRLVPGQWIGILLGGFLALVVFALFARTNPELFIKTWMGHSLQREQMLILGEVPSRMWDLRDIFRFTKEFFTHFPFLLLLTIIGGVIALKKRLTPVYFLLAWPIFTFILISAQTYRPGRYYYPIIPALALLASLALTQLFPVKSNRVKGKIILYILVILMCLFQMVRLIPHYRMGLPINSAMRAAADWLNTNLEPGEPVLSMYQTALLIHYPTIPAPQFIDERWKAAKDSTIVPALPWARFLLWTTTKTKKTTPITEWADQFTAEHFEIAARYEPFITIWERKSFQEEPSVK